jgi:hypothetical protein
MINVASSSLRNRKGVFNIEANYIQVNHFFEIKNYSVFSAPELLSQLAM